MIEFTVKITSRVVTQFNPLFAVDMPQYTSCVLDTGEVLVVLHADSKGQMPHKSEALDSAMRQFGRVDFITCCHPQQAKQENPEIAGIIIGDWSEKTSTSLFRNTGDFNAPVFSPQPGGHYIAPSSEVGA